MFFVDCEFFFQNFKILQEYDQCQTVYNSLGPDQAQHYVQI